MQRKLNGFLMGGKPRGCLLISYETLQGNLETMGKHEYGCMVCDEAHRRPEYVTYGVEHLGAEKQTRERQKIKKVTLRTCFLVIFFRFFSFSLCFFVLRSTGCIREIEYTVLY